MIELLLCSPPITCEAPLSRGPLRVTRSARSVAPLPGNCSPSESARAMRERNAGSLIASKSSPFTTEDSTCASTAAGAWARLISRSRTESGSW